MQLLLLVSTSIQFPIRNTQRTGQSTDTTTTAISAAAVAAALWAAFEARRSANAARKANATASALADIERQRRADELQQSAQQRKRERAELAVTLLVADKSQFGQAAINVHNIGAYPAEGFRIRGRLSALQSDYVQGDDHGWPFLARQDKLDDITLPPDRSVSVVVFDAGNAPALPEEQDRRLSYEILYRDTDGGHRLQGSFIYGFREGRWLELGKLPGTGGAGLD